jgi:hypothetical protein
MQNQYNSVSMLNVKNDQQHVHLFKLGQKNSDGQNSLLQQVQESSIERDGLVSHFPLQI